LLLSATPMTAAVVTTDHLDYAPGETAVITTSNQAGDGLQFEAGEMVRFQVSRTDGMADYVGSTDNVGAKGNEAWYVTDGAGGFAAHLGSDVSGDGVADWIAPDNDLTVNSSISTTWFVEEQYRNSSLLVTAQGQESGAMATQAFTDEAVNTTTVLTSNVFSSTYGDVVTFTATVTAAVGTDAPTGTVEFWDGSTLMGTATAPDSTGVGTSTWSIPSYQYLIEGSHDNIHAVFIGTVGSFNDSTSASITHTVAAKQITASFTVNDKVYDGTTSVSTADVTVTLTGVLAPDDVSLAFSSVTFSDANVSSDKIVTLTGATLIGTERLNYSLAPSTIISTGNITAKELTVNFTVDNKVYDGSTATTGLVTTLVGVIAPEDVTLSGGIATFDDANAGTGKTVTLSGATLSGADKENYSLASVNTTTANITKANAVIALAGYVGTYDGTAHQATGTATGVLGESLSGLDLSVTAHTNAGVYIDTVTFTDVTGNYKDTLKNVKSTINKANAVISLTGYVGTYDGFAHQATGTATGVLGEDLSAGLDLSVTAHTNAGVYIDTVVFTDVTGNYKDTLKNVKSTIHQANAVITLTGYDVLFDGLAHTATGTATGVLGEDLSAGLDLSSTTHTNVGTYLDTVTFTDATGNYKFTVKNVSNRIR
jgi:YDG domain/Bacterial Ig-like domain (group 3)